MPLSFFKFKFKKKSPSYFSVNYLACYVFSLLMMIKVNNWWYLLDFASVVKLSDICHFTCGVQHTKRN